MQEPTIAINGEYMIKPSEKEMEDFLEFLNSPEWKNQPIVTLPRAETKVEEMWGDTTMSMILMAVLMFPWFGTEEEKDAFHPFSGLKECERKDLNARFRLFCENLPESGMSIDMIPIQLRKAFGMEDING